MYNSMAFSILKICILSVSSVQFSLSVMFDSFQPMNCSMPGLPIHHQLPEFTQTHIHWVGDAIQPSSSVVVPFSSHLQSLPASESFPMSQLFAWGGQSIGVSNFRLTKKVLEGTSFGTLWLLGDSILTIPFLFRVTTVSYVSHFVSWDLGLYSVRACLLLEFPPGKGCRLLDLHVQADTHQVEGPGIW